MKKNEFSYTDIEFYLSQYSDQKTFSDISLSGIQSGIEYEKKYISSQKDKSFLISLRDSLNPTVNSGLLFPAILFDFPGFLVFERPPTEKLLCYVDVPVDMMNLKNFEGKEYTYKLPLPWQLYIAEYDPGTMLLYKVHMYFMKESFKNCNQIMYSPPIPNFYADGTLCRPFMSSMEDVERYDKTLSGVMASCYDWIWNSGFNHDLQECVLTIYNHKKNSFYDSSHNRTLPAHSSHRHLHPKDLRHVLETWEKKFTLENILTAEWANLSVTPVWDSEVEWFSDHDPEYPFDMAHEDMCEYECYEEYCDNFPIRTYDLNKSFSIMMDSCFTNNPNFGVVFGSPVPSLSSRFSAYYNLSS